MPLRIFRPFEDAQRVEFVRSFYTLNIYLKTNTLLLCTTNVSVVKLIQIILILLLHIAHPKQLHRLSLHDSYPVKCICNAM